METKLSFKSASLYDLTYKVQKNTLLNRGILEIGGIAIPQVAMSNNKDEALERAGLSGLFFSLSFLTPLVLIPQFNKAFLKKSGIVKDFKSVEKKILTVSKKYLSEDADTMIEGIRQKAKELDEASKDVSTRYTETFDRILERFPDKEELRKKLLQTHKNIYKSDFLSTAWMLAAAPWLCMEFTEHRTKKKGFSAAFNLKENDVDDKKYKADKRRKMIANAIVATIPALIVPGIVTRGIGKNHKALLESGNVLKKIYGKLLDLIKKKADCFDYTDSIYMSKTIFALMWLLSDYPNCLICSRDKHEVKDKAIRFGAMNVMFFGGDLVISKMLKKVSDKFAGKKMMKTKNLPKNKGKNASIYWTSLLINMALIGFGLPAILNRVLRKDIAKEKAQEAVNSKIVPVSAYLKAENSVFKDFKINP